MFPRPIMPTRNPFTSALIGYYCLSLGIEAIEDRMACTVAAGLPPWTGQNGILLLWTSYLDWGLDDFSGYIAADELYDGPFCVLSIVDNRTFKRLLYQVLEHDPDHQDITAFFHRFRMALRLRGLTLKGITTDASPLYPEPLREVFGDVPHRICEFDVIKELTKAILRAVAQVRKKLAAQKPAGQRGRPTTTAAKRIARRRQRLHPKIADLFEHRHLFVQHDLTHAERRTLQSITRGQPQLRAVRGLMEEVYRLFDRRCRTDTALARLAKLRQRVRRFKQVGKVLNKLRSPSLDKCQAPHLINRRERQTVWLLKTRQLARKLVLVARVFFCSAVTYCFVREDIHGGSVMTTA
jgi:hypothetical protein